MGSMTGETSFIKVRVTQAEYRKIRKKAHLAYLPTWEYLKQIVLKDIENVALEENEFTDKEFRHKDLKRMYDHEFERNFDEEETIVKKKLPLFGTNF